MADTPRGSPSCVDRALTLRQDWCSWLLHSRGRQPRTCEKYGTIIDTWIAWCGEHGVPALRPTQQDLERFIGRPRPRRGQEAGPKIGPAAPSTQNGEVVALKGWFQWMRNRGYLEALPYLPDEFVAPASRKARPKPVPAGHWVTMWEASMPASLRTAVGLARFGGLRRDELARARRSDLDMTSRTLTFTAKGGDEDVIEWGVMLDAVRQEAPHLAPEDATTEWLDVLAFHGHRDSRRGRVLPWTDPQTMNKMLRRHCVRLGLPIYTPHQLRHSCASDLVNEVGLPLPHVQELMRHSSYDMTLRYVARGASTVRDWLERRR